MAIRPYRPYPGRSVQQAVFSLLYVGKPGGQNRKNKPTAISGDRFPPDNEQNKETGRSRYKAAHQGVMLDEIEQKSAEAIVAECPV